MSGRGRAFKDYAYGDLSKFAVIDQIEGVKWLRKQPFVDEKRIACWGWSGGGYLTCMLMMRYNSDSHVNCTLTERYI